MMFRYALAVLSLLFLLTGCPLESKYSLGDSHDAQIDPRLIGNGSTPVRKSPTKVHFPFTVSTKTNTTLRPWIMIPGKSIVLEDI